MGYLRISYVINYVKLKGTLLSFRKHAVNLAQTVKTKRKVTNMIQISAIYQLLIIIGKNFG